MATGDITQAEILANGWQIKLRFEGLGTGGSYSFGYDSEYLPGDSAIVYSLTSPAYSGGVLTTRARTLWTGLDETTGCLRSAYPDQTDPQETVVGSDVDIIFPLSDYIFVGDTSLTVDIDAGLYTESGIPSNAISGLTVTNSSTTVYPMVVGNWFVPGRELVKEDFVIEFGAFHRYGIDQVDFEITDGTNTVNYSVTDMTVSTQDDYNKVLAYIKTVAVSTLSDGLLTVKATAYPYYGNSGAVLDTDDGVNTWPTPLYTNKQYRLDTVGVHGYCVLDSTSGDDSTGAVYSTQALAEAGSPYKTIPTALTALQTYHNTNAGHNDAGGGTILLTADTAVLDTTNGGTTTEWVTFTHKSDVLKSEAIIGSDGTSSEHPTHCKLYDISWTDTSLFKGGGDKMLWCDSVEINTTGSLSYYNSPFACFTHCSGTVARGFTQYSTIIAQFGLIRGNSFDSAVECQGYTTVGNRNVYQEDNTALASATQNNLIYAFNKIDAGTVMGVNIASTTSLENIAVIQNLLLRYGSITEPLMGISWDGSTTTTSNVLVWNNSVTGARVNMAYNDIASGPYFENLYSIKNNIFGNYNTKHDIFAEYSGATGGWPVMYAVGSAGNFYRTYTSDSFRGSFQGLKLVQGTPTVPLDPLYIEDNSAYGNDTSNGDYQLQALSEARGLGLEEVIPYDLGGVLRTTYDAGVYQYVETSNDIECDPIVLSGLIVGSSTIGTFIECDTLVFPSSILGQAVVTQSTIICDNLTFSPIGIGSAEILSEIGCDALILGKIGLSELEVQGVVYCDDLTVPYIAFSSAIVIGEIECNNLVLNNIILGAAIAGEIAPISPDVISVPGEITMSWTITGELV